MELFETTLQRIGGEGGLSSPHFSYRICVVYHCNSHGKIVIAFCVWLEIILVFGGWSGLFWYRVLAGTDGGISFSTVGSSTLDGRRVQLENVLDGRKKRSKYGKTGPWHP